MTLIHDLAWVALVGAGATVVLDLWLMGLRRLGARSLDMALIGRWVGHLARGRFAHAAIAKADPVKGERALGWATHYAIGVAIAGLLFIVLGREWIRAPTLLPAVAVGVGTVLAPLLVMQPAMGAGFASSRTPAPLKNSLRSVVNHGVFGVGLYAAAAVIALVVQ
ncbi:MAG TPA: DUF2938 domain-containing protein [Burkholderiaceae bacterium]|nr:DUF2938 domain-containing protein [Burkholderiaceae bacterium]